MSSNDEHAQSGDTIEITTHLRNDLGKRMQVSTSDSLSVIAMDNRMRVTVAHGDYKVVKRCGRPATADAPKKRGRPSNAELAARAQTPAAVEVPKATVEPKPVVVTDADVAGLEAALYDVPVTRKQAPAAVASTEHKAAQSARNAAASAAIEYVAAAAIDVPVTRKTVVEIAGRQGGKTAALSVDESKVTVASRDVSPEAYAALHADRIAREADYFARQAVCSPTQEQIDAATEGLRPLYGISQKDFDEMTRQTEPRGFVQVERKHSHYFKPCPFDEIDVYRVLERFNVTDQAIGHALKKLLVAGGRGVKDIGKDVQEAIDTLTRWQEMRAEEQDAA